MIFENLTKDQLVEILSGIKFEVDFIAECAEVSRKNAKIGIDSGWHEGKASAYEQSAKWINDRMAKYEQQSTRP